MKYAGVNRVFRIDDGGAYALYVAPTQAAAAKAHAKRTGTKKLRNGQKPVEVPADRLIVVGCDDAAEAIGHLTDANAALLRPTIAEAPAAHEYVGLTRAAEQWARMTAAGATRFLAAFCEDA